MLIDDWEKKLGWRPFGLASTIGNFLYGRPTAEDEKDLSKSIEFDPSKLPIVPDGNSKLCIVEIDTDTGEYEILRN